MMMNPIQMLIEHNQIFWFAAALILIILEVALGANFFLLWLGISAASVGGILLLYAGFVWWQQCFLFAAISLACLLYWNIHLKHVKFKSDQPHLNQKTAQYIGRIYTLREPIVNGRGRLQIHDTFWNIEGDDLPAGVNVKVIRVDDLVLKVQKV